MLLLHNWKLMMINLNTNSLEDISRYKDKLLKLASFFSHSESVCFTDNISRIPDSSDEFTILTAFDKDVNKTADFISKSTKLLSTTDDQGVITGAKDKPQIKEIFKDNYRPSTNTVELAGLILTTNTFLDKDTVKDMLFKNLFNISTATYQSIKKQTKKVYTINKNNIDSTESSIQYLAELPFREKHEKLLSKIKSIKGNAESVRSKYINNKLDNKYDSLNLIDRKITGSRAMVDSITKASTHISKSSIHQHSPKHSELEIKHLFDTLKDNIYISDIEIDSDADVSKVTDLVKQIRGLKLNLKNDFTLKVRKLGNYKAHGLCMPSQNIVAVNVDKPSSLIHELTHLVDLTNGTVKSSPQREILISKFRSKLDLEKMGDKTNYFSCDEEIIARLGEISYLLNKFDYNGESISEFTTKVHSLETDNVEMCTVKGIDTYLNSKNIYFGFGDETILPPKDMLEIKEYFNSYWGIDKDFVQETTIYTQKHKEKYISKRFKPKAQNKFTPTAFSNINEESVIESYELSKSEDVMEPHNFTKEILVNMQHLFRSKKRIRGEEVLRQFRTVNNLFRHVFKSGSDSDKESSLTHLLRHTGNYSLGTPTVVSKFLENLPLDEAKGLFDEATYKDNNDNIFTKKLYPDGTDYLNDYGQKTAQKTLSILITDFINSIDADSFNNVLLELKPNSKAFYEAVLLRQELANTDELIKLQSFLSSRGWLSLFKFDRVELLAKRLDYRFRSISTIWDAQLTQGEIRDISILYHNIMLDLRLINPNANPSDLYFHPNRDELISDAVSAHLDANFIPHGSYGDEESISDIFTIALLGEIKSQHLKNLGSKIDILAKDLPINNFKNSTPPKNNPPTIPIAPPSP